MVSHSIPEAGRKNVVFLDVSPKHVRLLPWTPQDESLVNTLAPISLLYLTVRTDGLTL